MPDEERSDEEGTPNGRRTGWESDERACKGSGRIERSEGGVHGAAAPGGREEAQADERENDDGAKRRPQPQTREEQLKGATAGRANLEGGRSDGEPKGSERAQSRQRQDTIFSGPPGREASTAEADGKQRTQHRARGGTEGGQPTAARPHHVTAPRKLARPTEGRPQRASVATRTA